MKTKHLRRFPQPLLQDLVEGRWLPIVGAGFSRNAILPAKKQMPMWDDLGKALASEMEDYPYTGALDGISAYAHEYSRTRLIERISELLHTKEARPGPAHQAFCSLQFDIVCTTNFDFLLEHQYQASQRYCRPIIDEEHLAVNSRDPSVALIKLHGDLHHPQRMVVTEEDYDLFLDRYPLLATYLANLLITRTAILIGYSLDDPDFRQIWQVVCNRLGRLRRQAYAIAVDAGAAEIARYERRGIKVISLKGSKSKYGEILAEAFQELREHLETNIIPSSKITEESALKELSLPKGTGSRLCFFAVPFSLQALYRDHVFPLAAKNGLVPVTADEIVAPGDNILAKIDALIGRAAAVVIDASNAFTLFEAGLARAKLPAGRIMIVTSDGRTFPTDLAGIQYLVRPKESFADLPSFLGAMEQWFANIAAQIEPQLAEEPERLLKLGEYRPAVISALTHIEALLRKICESVTASSSRPTILGNLLEIARQQERLSEDEVNKVRSWMRIRNEALHLLKPVSANTAREIVRGAAKVTAKLRE